MTEEQLNENLIKSELQCICQDCIYLDKIVPIIRQMLSEEYRAGLEQSRFDKNMLEQENQELKKQLNSDDWINSIKETERHYIYLIENENQELKKKLDELQMLYNNMFKCHCNRVQVETLLSQQKEFIEWLKNKLILMSSVISTEDDEDNRYYAIVKRTAFDEVLSKYKEITGDKDES